MFANPILRTFRTTATRLALVAIAIATPLAPAPAQLSPHGQMIVDMLGVHEWEDGRGAIQEISGYLVIEGYRVITRNGTQVRVPVIESVKLNQFITVLELAGRDPNSSASGALTGGTAPTSAPISGGVRSPSVLADTRTVIGYIDNGGSTPYNAFRRTQAGGVVSLGTLGPVNSTTHSSFATGISSDASVIVGYSDVVGSTAQHAFRWTNANGMTDMGVPAGATFSSRALGIGAAGDVIVGDASFNDANAFSGVRTGAFRWTSGGGFQSLGALEPGFFSTATAVSSDGSVVVGQGGVQIVVGNSSTNGSKAFRWSSANGIQAIGPLPGHTHAIATAVSDNGKIVVGTSSAGILQQNLVLGSGRGTAFRWTAATGIKDLREQLVAAGVALNGIALVTVTGISADGQFIQGQATTPLTAPGEFVPYILQYCDDAIDGTCRSIVQDAPTFSLTPTDNGANTVAAGQSVTKTLTITPSGGFTQAVTFACSGLPTATTCAFAPASVTPTSSAITTVVTITTRLSAASLFVTRVPTALVAITIGVALVLLLRNISTRGVSLRPIQRQRIGIRPLVATTVIAMFGSCGGGDSRAPVGPAPITGTPAGSYTVTVTATSGSGASAISKTSTISLTVTR